MNRGGIVKSAEINVFVPVLLVPFKAKKRNMHDLTLGNRQMYGVKSFLKIFGK